MECTRILLLRWACCLWRFLRSDDETCHSCCWSHAHLYRWSMLTPKSLTHDHKAARLNRQQDWKASDLFMAHKTYLEFHLEIALMIQLFPSQSTTLIQHLSHVETSPHCFIMRDVSYVLRLWKCSSVMYDDREEWDCRRQKMDKGVGSPVFQTQTQA